MVHAERAERIRQLVTSARISIIMVGEELITAKKEHPREFVAWLKQEFDWSKTTAYKYMRVAEAFWKFPLGGNSAIDGLTIDASAAVPASLRANVVYHSPLKGKGHRS